MSLTEWASAAEIVGAIAVTLSLIFVGVQIRKNTTAEQANTLQNSINQDVAILMALGTDRETGELLTAYTFTPETLPAEKLQQGRWLFAANVRHWENMYLQHQSGTISDEAWSAREHAVNNLLATPGWDEYTSSDHAMWMSGPFVEYAKRVREVTRDKSAPS